MVGVSLRTSAVRQRIIETILCDIKVKTESHKQGSKRRADRVKGRNPPRVLCRETHRFIQMSEREWLCIHPEPMKSVYFSHPHRLRLFGIIRFGSG